MSSSENREEALFEAALQIPADQRRDFLTKACGVETDLLNRISRLLQAFERADGFLETPATPGSSRPEIVSPNPGDHIGRYKLLEQIGEGGCGVVYVAEQEEPVRRRVALKIIKLGMDTKSVIARFDAERQALAMMDHPNIARVFDASATETGRPYFVMELVRGVQITDYCNQNSLAPRARLELFIQVCRAIQHAHQKGIIHRDIKPSNILVTLHDGIPVPKVIDFGIAKATQGRLTDQTVYTAFEQFIGTPAYMSPEQAEMSSIDIDTRSDIYSLGVLLYELLTGKTPFDAKELLAAGLNEIRRTIREVEPLKPSTRITQDLTAAEVKRVSAPGEKQHKPSREFLQEVRGDLDWIVMKCLEKDRTRRYETATGLASEIERHLRNEPINARPQTALHRGTKWVERNKVLFASGVCVIGAIVIGSAIGISQYIAKSRAYDQVVRSQLVQETLRKEAQRQKSEAELEAARSGQIVTFLKEMLESVAPGVAQGKDTKLLRDVLDRTAERIDRDLKVQPEVQAELYLIVGQTYAHLGLQDRAEKMFQATVDRLTKARIPENAALAEALGLLAVTQATQGRSVAAQPNADKALRIARQLNEPGLLSDVLRQKARSLDPDQDLPEAIPFLKEALTFQRRAATNLIAEADILRQLGGALAWGTNLDEASRDLHEALALHAKSGGTNDFSTARDWFNLSQIAAKRGDFPEAERDVRNSLSIVTPILDRGHQSRVDSTAFLAHFLALQGKWAEAETLLKAEKNALPNDSRYRLLLGTLYARQKLWTNAANELLSATSVLNDPNYVPFNAMIALLKAGRTNECLSLWRASMKRTGATQQYDFADKLAKSGLLLPIQGEEFEKAAALADYAGSATGPSWLLPWVRFVKSLAELRRENFKSAAEWAQKSYDDRNATAPCRAGAYIVGSMAANKLGLTKEALTAFEKGTKLIRTAPPETGNFEGRWAPWAVAEILADEAAQTLDHQ